MSLFLASIARAEDRWHKPWTNKLSDDQAIERLFKLLETTSTGKEILRLAAIKDPDFRSHISVGANSLTESTYSRTYSLDDGAETVTLHHRIFLGKHLSLADAVVDLGHELTHFALREVMNPYQENFEYKIFVRKGIEGNGGELDAFEQECLLAKEFEKKSNAFPEHRLCRKYWGSNEGFDRELARKDFYAVGKFPISDELKEAIPELENREVVFVSAFAKMPYPMALDREFRDTRVRVCENNGRKMQLMSAHGRGPSSVVRQEETKRLQMYRELYCREVK